jgi:hypothetical protein
MPVIRTFGCDDCGLTFEVTQGMDDPHPECPRCCQVLEWRPTSFAIVGNKSRAIDVTQKIMEQDYGYSNFNDNMREGDVAAKPAAAATGAQIDAEIRQVAQYAAQTTGAPPLTNTQAEMAKAFWAGGQTPLQNVPAAEMLNNAKASTALANAEGRNPMNLLHKAGKKGQLRTPINVIARA